MSHIKQAILAQAQAPKEQATSADVRMRRNESNSNEARVALGLLDLVGPDRGGLWIAFSIQFCGRKSLARAALDSFVSGCVGPAHETPAFCRIASALSVLTRNGERIGKNPNPRHQFQRRHPIDIQAGERT